MSELSLIDAFLRPFGRAAGEGVLVGPGSDCAVVRPTRGQRLVATTDAVVEGVHFDPSFFTPADVGHKALAVNLSDLAAAGARPRWFLCALGVPREVGAQRYAAAMARGMMFLSRKYGCAIVGGNVSAAREWSVTITALGEARRPVTRAGGRPGDALVLAGALGDAAAGLRVVRRLAGEDLRKARTATRAQRRPVPLVEAGLAAARLVSASIDVSDGLLRDLGHLCAQSRCGAVVECAALPIGRFAKRERDALDLALTGGEDYALLFSVPRRRLAALLRVLPGAVEIGELVAGAAVALVHHGVSRPAPSTTGYDHLP